MKSVTKKIAGGVLAAAFTFGFLTFVCKANSGSANVAFAETAALDISIPEDSIKVTQALQTTFRSISEQVFPAVVEVDVTSKKTVNTYNPFKDFGFGFDFGFGSPFGDDEDSTKEIEQTALGSGVIVRKNKNTVYVLTNNHVAGGADSIKIKLNDKREFKGKLVGGDERMDIALVSFEVSPEDKITVAKLGNSDTVHQGDIVLALGSPLGYFASVTQGIVSATGRSGNGIGSISDFIQTDAAINQGNSGGPLVNIYGEIIGINTWIASNSGGNQGLGFSIPINNIKKSINEFIDNGEITYGWLGASLMEPNEDFKKELGLDQKDGAFVAELFLEGPAIKGGMKVGDYITELNGVAIKDSSQLVLEVGKLIAGSKAEFKVIRGGKTVTLNILIEKRSNEVAANTSKIWPGFTPVALTDEIRKQMKIDDDVKGVFVASVEPKSPAASLNITKGVVITAINDKKITNLKEFYAELDTQSKDKVWFTYWKDGHTLISSQFPLKKR
ncbi:MAG: Do family serine endopeptidase [Treponema sp.]|nr:Do family serine endopeptidase [Treponema sp.]